MIRFSCQCGRQLQASENYIGQLTACPVCGQTNIVPPMDSPPRGARINDLGEIVRTEEKPEIQPPPRVAPQPAAPFRYGDADEDAPPYPNSFGQQRSCQDAQTALILGVAGILCCALCYPLAIIYGLRALNQINESHGQLSGRGMAIAGLVLGIIGTCLVGIYMMALFAGGL